MDPDAVLAAALLEQLFKTRDGPPNIITGAGFCKDGIPLRFREDQLQRNVEKGSKLAADYLEIAKLVKEAYAAVGAGDDSKFLKCLAAALRKPDGQYLMAVSPQLMQLIMGTAKRHFETPWCCPDAAIIGCYLAAAQRFTPFARGPWPGPADTFFRKATQAYPADPDIWAWWANWYIYDDAKRSIACLDKAIERGGHPELYVNRAGAYKNIPGVADTKIKGDYRQFLSLVEPHHRDVPKAYFSLAWMEMFTRASGRVDMRGPLGLYYYQKGRAAGLAMPSFMQGEWQDNDNYSTVHKALVSLGYINKKGELTSTGKAVYEEQVKIMEGEEQQQGQVQEQKQEPVGSSCGKEPGDNSSSSQQDVLQGTETGQDQSTPEQSHLQVQQQGAKKSKKKSHNKKKKHH